MAVRRELADNPYIPVTDWGLMGYTVWWCIAPVSFTTGEMGKRYGFIYVDQMDDGSGSYKKISKDSFAWYKNVIASNGANL